MGKLSKSDVALLQARSAYNDARIVKVIDGHGYTVGKDTVVIEMNRMAFGLFESTILKAFKERQDLRDRNWELVMHDKDCAKCEGAGKMPYVPGTAEYNSAYDTLYRDLDNKLEDGAPEYGTPIAKFCSPCQGTGIVLKPQPQKE